MARRLFQGGMSGIFYHQNMPLILTKFIFGPFVKSGIFKTSSYTRASNVKMPADYQWKILKQQFNRLNYLNDHSRFVTYQYNLVLSKIGCPIFWESAYRENVVLIRYPLIVQKPERFLNYFARFNIEIGRWFSSPVSGANILDGFSYKEGSCPNAEWIGKHIVNLPLNSRINQNILNVISIGLKTYFDEYPEDLEWIRNLNASLYK
jgi:dTDP-4-amino-4,6-dideoxygalactose transaminase